MWFSVRKSTFSSGRPLNFYQTTQIDILRLVRQELLCSSSTPNFIISLMWNTYFVFLFGKDEYPLLETHMIKVNERAQDYHHQEEMQFQY